ncbi:AraC family transcriptional regulator [Consotaella salsifontis]|uniref:Transcriptional regulator, AraC family n=1 Tax=Consotaella salsifontis TaxID=1365950 RepID=A0A1T4SF10_9HYPH|nr:AraC family transcriptional regulator [Consotaella salsifontis]SKA26920.1 transcriptional regulator, AraC family [Consotaella salsifontis]
MSSLPDPMSSSVAASLTDLAFPLAPKPGYNPTALPSIRILRSNVILEDVPVLYRPGAVFVLRGSKQGLLDGTVYRYDADHYLAVAVPVPFRMTSEATSEQPLLAIYVDFDLQLAAEIAVQLEAQHRNLKTEPARSLVSSRMEPAIEDMLRRTLRMLADPTESAILGPGVLRELHYRVLIGPQGGALVAALQQRGTTGRIVRSLARIREGYSTGLSVPDLAAAAGMSVPSYHAHFKALTGSTPIQYVKAIRLHEARLMIARRNGPVAAIAGEVGYASAAQFSRDFRRHFGRSPTEEAGWVREHLGEIV